MEDFETLEIAEVETLRRLVQDGLDSGPGLDADVVFHRLHGKFGRLVEECAARLAALARDP